MNDIVKEEVQELFCSFLCNPVSKSFLFWMLMFSGFQTMCFFNCSSASGSAGDPKEKSTQLFSEG